MRMRHAAVAGLLSVTALAAPAAARAATLAADPAKPCYGTADRVSLSGAGFTPASKVDISRDGNTIGAVRSNSAGSIAALATVPSIARSTQTSSYTATDRTDPSILASVPVKLSRLRVTVRPGDSPASRPRRIRARGFTAGRTLYVHLVRGKRRRNLRVGRLRGACKTINTVRRIFGSNARVGSYRVQFDTFRRYRARRRQRVRFTVELRRTFSSSAASTPAGVQTWRPGR